MPSSSAAHPEAVLADVRWYLDGRDGRAAFEAGHIPGAVWVDLDHQLAGARSTRNRGPPPISDARELRRSDGLAGHRQRHGRGCLRRHRRADSRTPCGDVANDRLRCRGAGRRAEAWTGALETGRRAHRHRSSSPPPNGRTIVWPRPTRSSGSSPPAASQSTPVRTNDSWAKPTRSTSAPATSPAPAARPGRRSSTSMARPDQPPSCASTITASASTTSTKSLRTAVRVSARA